MRFDNMNKAEKKQAEKKRLKEERKCPRCKKVFCNQKALESHIKGTDGLIFNRCLPILPVYRGETIKPKRQLRKKSTIEGFPQMIKIHS